MLRVIRPNAMRGVDKLPAFALFMGVVAMPHLLNAPNLEVAARVRDNILDALQELTDLAWQRRVWFGDGTGPEMSSFVEAACSLFDDSTISMAFAADLVVFDDEIDEKLATLRRLLRAFGQWGPEVSELDSDAWQEVRATAGELHALISGLEPW